MHPVRLDTAAALLGLHLVRVERVDDVLGEGQVVQELSQDHVMVDHAIVLIVVAIRDHVIRNGRDIVQLPVVLVQLLVVDGQAAQHIVHVLTGRLAGIVCGLETLRPILWSALLVVIPDHVDALCDLLEALVQLD